MGTLWGWNTLNISLLIMAFCITTLAISEASAFGGAAAGAAASGGGAAVILQNNDRDSKCDYRECQIVAVGISASIIVIMLLFAWRMSR